MPLTHDWTLAVVDGPHGAPDFFQPDDIAELFSATYEVHFNAARTGVRLIGSTPRWARADGCEAGLHPSNLHDDAYAPGSIDFTGDMPGRAVHLPWNDPEAELAMRRYQETVRPNAPWCPSNIEFIRRINGLDSTDDGRRIVFDASYLALGLGDVHLGAPVATPTDPRHRLVTTRYNPARTWTPENAVGIGGA